MQKSNQQRLAQVRPVTRWWKLFKQAPIFVPASYAFFASLWIFFSDRTVAALVDDPQRLTQLQTYKGWFFVTITTLMLAALIYWRQRVLHELNASLEHRVRERTAALESANAELARVIDDLKSTRDDLVRAEKLAALGTMVAGVAHRLNTPIGNGLVVASTLGEETAHLAQELARGGLRKSVFERYLHQAQQATTLLLNNLSKASELVTSFKQLAVDRASADRRQFQLEEVANEVRSALGSNLNTLPIAVHWNVPPTLSFDSYPGPLAQVIRHLIQNAVVHGFDSTPRNGQIEISASDLDNGTVLLKVADNGSGIPNETIERIFEPFFSTRFGSGGSGLGLPVVHHLVREVLGGRIEVAHRPGGGVEFSVYLPRQAPINVSSATLQH